MEANESRTFNYTGGVQTFTVPNSGLYFLECWGGGNSNNVYDNAGTAYGGYVSGYKYLKKGVVLYICCGGSSGYNGGGAGKGDHYAVWAYVSANNGSGATHIALVNGVLTDIGETSFCNNGNGLLIAGGAGGCQTHSIANGTTAARRGGAGGTGGGNGHFGYGNNGPTGEHDHGGGGGGGYRGGLAAGASGSGVPDNGAQGGTNWIGNVPAIVYKGTTYSPSSSSGTGSGSNGYAKITLIKKGGNSKIGGKEVTIYFGTKEVTAYLGTKEV